MCARAQLYVLISILMEQLKDKNQSNRIRFHIIVSIHFSLSIEH